MWSKDHKHDKTDNYKKTGEDTVSFIFMYLLVTSQLFILSSDWSWIT